MKTYWLAVVVALITVVVFLALLFYLPNGDDWNGAVLQKVCNSRMIIVRKADGSLWLVRSEMHKTYRVEKLEGVC